MTVTPIYFLGCRDVMYNDRTGQISLVDLIDGITVSKFPMKVGPMSLVAQMYISATTKKDESIKFYTTILRPNGKIVKQDAEPDTELSVPIKPATKKQKVGLNLDVPELILQEEGEHVFNLFVDDKQVGKYSLNVSKK